MEAAWDFPYHIPHNLRFPKIWAVLAVGIGATNKELRRPKEAILAYQTPLEDYQKLDSNDFFAIRIFLQQKALHLPKTAIFDFVCFSLSR